MNTGNKTVDEIGKIQLTGNIIPGNWYKRITFTSGKADPVSILILSEIVYWHRPTIVKDEYTGQIVEVRKKFKSDLLQRSYDSFADQFGISKRQARESIIRLEEQGILERVFRTVPSPSGPLSNVLFLKIDPEKIYDITFNSVPYDIETPEGSHQKAIAPTLKSQTYTEITTDKNLLTAEALKAKQEREKDFALTREIVGLYQNHIQLSTGPNELDKINHWFNLGDFPLIVYAFNRMVEKGYTGSKWAKEKFIDKLLSDWKKANIKDPAEAMAYEEKNDPANKASKNKTPQPAGSKYGKYRKDDPE